MYGAYKRQVEEPAVKSRWRLDFEEWMEKQKNLKVIHRVALPVIPKPQKVIAKKKEPKAKAEKFRSPPKSQLVERTKFCQRIENGIACGKPLNRSNRYGVCKYHYEKHRRDIVMGAKPTCLDCGIEISRGNKFGRCKKHSMKLYVEARKAGI